MLRRPDTLILAFAAETGSAQAIANGRAKLLRKGADAIVINDVSKPDAGFDSENNAATVLAGDREIDLPLMNKARLADRILDELVVLRNKR